MTQEQLLEFLKSKGNQSISLKDVAEHFDVNQSRITNCIKTLVKKNLVSHRKEHGLGWYKNYFTFSK